MRLEWRKRLIKLPDRKAEQTRVRIQNQAKFNVSTERWRRSAAGGGKAAGRTVDARVVGLAVECCGRGAPVRRLNPRAIVKPYYSDRVAGLSSDDVAVHWFDRSALITGV